MSAPEHPELLAAVRGLLEREFGFAPDRIRPETHLVDDLEFDSIDAISLAVRVEEEMGIKLDEQSLKSVRTIGEVLELIARHRAPGSS